MSPDPLDLMRDAGAFYEAPRDAAGRRAGRPSPPPVPGFREAVHTPMPPELPVRLTPRRPPGIY